MNNKPEHTADISAELRTLSRGAKLYGLQPTVYGKPISIYFAELADRIDAASVGNCAAMRHAIAIAVGDLQNNLEMTPDERQFMARYLKAAIDKPARQCDVGTAEEQAERFHIACHSTGIGSIKGRTDCSRCLLYKNTIRNCVIAWTQLPYDESGVRQ